MKVGLEIHQQLATGKLFCGCPTELSEEVLGEFTRRLHATTGETGITDRAAEAQASRGLTFRYQISPHSCLVEADDEPPHALNAEAVRVGLILSELLGSRVVDEAMVMRKIVVDGSNTSGFQRTALLAVGGSLKLADRSISISSLCLEEDAARKIGEAGHDVTYRLDRLGIPLLEIATGPDLRSGKEAREAAEMIGDLLRCTGKVKRGLGTIREDLNVSIEGGARVEIKGVQQLRWIDQYVENEVERQQMLLRVKTSLDARGATPPQGPGVDVTPLFASTQSKLVKDVLGRGGVAWALALPKFGGLFGNAKENPERLGREIADYARSRGVKGLLHSDELPGYGITAPEVDRLREVLRLTSPEDGFVMVVAPSETVAQGAILAARDRAVAALQGVPEETRDPLPEGRTRFSRPLPGRHRMYPETDVPPRGISPQELEAVRSSLPERPEETLNRLVKVVGLSREVARPLIHDGLVGVFDVLRTQGHPPSVLGRLLTQDLPALEEEVGHPLGEEDGALVTLVGPALEALAKGEFAKEGLAPVLRRQVLQHEDLKTAILRAGVVGLSEKDLEALISEVLDANASLIATRAMGALSPLMGDVMARVRGKRDGQEVAAAVRRMLTERVAASSLHGQASQ